VAYSLIISCRGDVQWREAAMMNVVTSGRRVCGVLALIIYGVTTNKAIDV